MYGPGSGHGVNSGGHAHQTGQAHDGVRCGSHGRAGDRTLSRVGFLGTGLVAAATVAGLSAPRATGSPSVQVWGLDPSGTTGPQPCGCSGCSACNAHAANKLFASVSDAGANRAHVFCKCVVVPLALVDASTYNALFVDGGSRASADRRAPWVQDVLAKVPAVPAPSTAQNPASAAPTQAASAASPDSADHHVQARLAHVRWLKSSKGGRVLYVDIDAAEAVTVSLELARGKTTVARRRVTGLKGRQTLKVAIPASMRAGSAHLHAEFHDAAGNAKRTTQAIAIPTREHHASMTSPAKHPSLGGNGAPSASTTLPLRRPVRPPRA